jgi:DNA-binding transcriptional regulator/RsmH inhibitor MraZ
VDVSRDGRLTLPKNLAARCDLANEVTVWPRVDRLEIVAGRKLPSKADDERIEDVYRGFRKEVFD